MEQRLYVIYNLDLGLDLPSTCKTGIVLEGIPNSQRLPVLTEVGVKVLVVSNIIKFYSNIFVSVATKVS